MALSDIVTVNILLQAAQVLQQGFGVPLILGATSRFTDRIRFYSDLAGMTADGFLTTDPEYLAATKMLSQSPRVKQFAIGRRASLPTQRWTITPVAQNNAVYKVQIGTQTASFTADGTATVDEINQGLVAAITALGIAGLTAALVGVAGSSTAFTIAATTPGAWFEVQVLDVSLLSLVQDSADPGLAADLAAIIAVDNTWYGLTSVFAGKAEVEAIAAWAEANGKLFVQQVQDSDCLTSSTTDVMSALKTSAYARTAPIYHPDNGAFADAAWLGRMLPLDPGSADWAFKSLSGVAAVALTTSQVNNLKAKYGNYYVTVAGVDITLDGKVSADEWIDVILARDWLTARIQEREFALLTSSNKVPYTDEGIALVEKEVRAQLQEGIDNDVIAASPAPTVTVPRAADVSAADKTNRVLNNVVFTATLAGAIHQLTISGTVSFYPRLSSRPAMSIPTQPTTFDPSQVIITWGAILFSGYADGSFVKVTRNSDTFKTTVGADGTVARTRSADKSGNVEIDLMQSSATNDLISAQAAADELTGAAAAPLQIKDLMGRTLVIAKLAWVRKPADVEFGKELGSRKWVFDCDRLDLSHIGGN